VRARRGRRPAAAREFLADRKIEADVVEVGCTGLCSSEPMLDVQLPERTRVSFEAVTGERVAGLLEAVLGRRIPGEGLLGQFRSPTLAPWPDVPYLDEHPFFAPQTRWVLANCGIMDPTSIDEYIARGGYRALAGALRAHTPSELCEIVERSGLRGRGGGAFRRARSGSSPFRPPANRST